MTTLREAALMALEALDSMIGRKPEHVVNAITNLRAALEYQARQDEACDNLERYTQEMRIVMRSMPQFMGMTTDEHVANFSTHLQTKLNEAAK